MCSFDPATKPISLNDATSVFIHTACIYLPTFLSLFAGWKISNRHESRLVTTGKNLLS